MGFWELWMLAAGLSMDAFAVAVCKGLAVRRLRCRHLLLTGGYFGAFQALMPLLGYVLGSGLAGAVIGWAPFVSGMVLTLIGAHMLCGALSGEEEGENDSFSAPVMLPLAVATSIDALAAGLSFALLHVAVVPAALLIGATTFCCAAAGVGLGHGFGGQFRTGAGALGGILLVLLGLRLLLRQWGY